MPRSGSQKLKILYVARYLCEKTDEEHPVTTAELIGMLEKNGIAAERKSIYDDIEQLREFGLDVERCRCGSSTGWFVAERRFQLPELRLLVDTVQSSRFLTRRKSMELIEKLESLTNEQQARTLRRQVWVKKRIKTMNESIYYIVDDLHAAISGDRQISFRYYTNAPNGDRIFRHGGKSYVMSPWALLCDDENYYLLCFDAEADMIKHFRVDKLAELRLLDRKREGRTVFEQLRMDDYTNTHFGMFSGEADSVRLRCENALAGAVVDRFGSDVILIPDGGGHFLVTVHAVLSGPFYGWICSFAGGIRILSPEKAVSGLRKTVQSIAAQHTEENEAASV